MGCHRSLAAARIKLAERGGFEPPIRFNPYNGLANRRLQPLGHLSNNQYNQGVYEFLDTLKIFTFDFCRHFADIKRHEHNQRTELDAG